MAADFAVRPAGSADADAVGSLLRATYPLHFAQAYTPELLAVALPLMTRPNLRLLASGTFYVAVLRAGDLVGCGGWTFERPGGGEASEGLGHIRHFATHPNWSRRGIGRAILERCFRDARTRGVRRLECYSSLVAEEFYRAMGFDPAGRIDIDLNADATFPAILMRRDIA